MAQDFAAFLEQAAQLQSQGDKLNIEREDVVAQLQIANEQVKNLRQQLQDIDKGIIDNKESKQAMMQGAAEAHGIVQPLSHTVKNTINYGTEDEDDENIIVAPRTQRSAMSISKDKIVQSSSSLKPCNSQAQSATTNAPNTGRMNASTQDTVRQKNIATFDTSYTGPAAWARLWALGNSIIINDKYLTVVSIDHKWTEISCKICSANSTYESKSLFKPQKFFTGVLGLYNHIVSHRAKQFKGEPKPALEVVLKCFRMRKLSYEDVELIKRGNHPVIKISKRTCTSKASINNALVARYLNVSQLATDEDAPSSEDVGKGKTRAKGRTKDKEAQKGYDYDDEEELPVVKRQRHS